MAQRSRALAKVTPLPRAESGSAHNRARRQSIIATGARLMHDRGFHATSVQDVADEFAFTKAAFYYYMRDKEELLYGILSQTLRNVTERVSAIAETERSPDEKIRAIVDAYIKMISEGPEFFTVYFRDRPHLAPKHQREIARMERALVDTIAGIMRRAMDKRSVRRADAYVWTFGVIGMCLWSSLWYKPKGRLTVDEVSQSLQALARDGYASRQSNRSR